MDTKYLDIIKAPVITEKSKIEKENGKYTFKVDPKANKTEIKLAIEKIFNVKVVDIKTINERKNINLELLSQRLLDTRKERNLTQSELSKDVGYHQRTYAHYENGSRIPTSFKVFYIALYYNISLDYLVGKSDIKEIAN